MAEAKPQSTRDEIMAGLGAALNDVEVFHNQLLIGIYIRPQKTSGGIILTDTTRDEDKWQGKVGLVLQRGPQAFVSEGGITFQSDASVGDWVIYRVSDGFSIDINHIHCRIIEDVHIRGRIADPALIW
jgi:co-chaperonin GroES (HSP10)